MFNSIQMLRSQLGIWFKTCYLTHSNKKFKIEIGTRWLTLSISISRRPHCHPRIEFLTRTMVPILTRAASRAWVAKNNLNFQFQNDTIHSSNLSWLCPNIMCTFKVIRTQGRLQRRPWSVPRWRRRRRGMNVPFISSSQTSFKIRKFQTTIKNVNV